LSQLLCQLITIYLMVSVASIIAIVDNRYEVLDRIVILIVFKGPREISKQLVMEVSELLDPCKVHIVVDMSRCQDLLSLVHAVHQSSED